MPWSGPILLPRPPCPLLSPTPPRTAPGPLRLNSQVNQGARRWLLEKYKIYNTLTHYLIGSGCTVTLLFPRASLSLWFRTQTNGSQTTSSYRARNRDYILGVLHHHRPPSHASAQSSRPLTRPPRANDGWSRPRKRQYPSGRDGGAGRLGTLFSFFSRPGACRHYRAHSAQSASRFCWIRSAKDSLAINHVVGKTTTSCTLIPIPISAI